MATLVTKYQADDGTLFDSRREAEKYEETRDWLNALSMLAYYTAGDLDREKLVAWLMEHKKTIGEMVRWPDLKESEVCNALGLEAKPEPEEEPEGIIDMPPLVVGAPMLSVVNG